MFRALINVTALVNPNVFRSMIIGLYDHAFLVIPAPAGEPPKHICTAPSA